MKKLEIFKPEDFNSVYSAPAAANSTGVMALIANEILNQWLSQQTKVTGEYSESMFGKGVHQWNAMLHAKDTHQAILINIHPIEKEPCKHEPKFTEGNGFGASIVLGNNECRFCGIKLKATWSADE